MNAADKKAYDAERYQKTKEQQKAYSRHYYQQHRDVRRVSMDQWQQEHRTELNQYYVEYRAKNKAEFIQMYGGRCACCGEARQEFLTIEHKQGQRGRKRDITHTAYRKALKEYRPDLYEVLCFNCNCAKGFFGYCPHEKEKQDA